MRIPRAIGSQLENTQSREAEQDTRSLDYPTLNETHPTSGYPYSSQYLFFKYLNQSEASFLSLSDRVYRPIHLACPLRSCLSLRKLLSFTELKKWPVRKISHCLHCYYLQQIIRSSCLWGACVAQLAECLLLAQVMVLGSSPAVDSPVLWEPASPSAPLPCLCSFSFSNK